MIKGSIQKEDTIIESIYAPSIGAPQHVKQILTILKGEIDSNTIRVRDFNNSLSSMNISFRQKTNIETRALLTLRMNLWLLGLGEWRKGIVKMFGMDMYTLLYFKWMTNKILLYSTEKSA